MTLINEFSGGDVVSDRRELDLSDVSAWDELLAGVEEVYREAVSHQARAESDKYLLLAIDDVSGEEIMSALHDKYQRLLLIIADCKRHVLSDEEIDDVQFDKLQQYYDDLVSIRDHIVEVYSGDEDFYLVEPAVEEESFVNVGGDEVVVLPELSEVADGLVGGIAGAEVSLETSAPAIPETTSDKEDFAAEDEDFILPLDEEFYANEFEVEVSEDSLVVLTPNVTRKDISIQSEEDGGELKINYSPAVNNSPEIEPAATEMPSLKSAIHHHPLNPIRPTPPPAVPVSIISSLEHIHPINQAQNAHTPQIFTPDPIHQKTSLVEQYLWTEPYASFVKKAYSSPKALEKIVGSTITRIEKGTVDALERWLNETHNSAFVFLQEMFLSEVRGLKSSQEVRKILEEKDIKYETFIAWMDIMDEMLVIVEEYESMTFGELFVKWLVTLEMEDMEAAINL